MSEPNPPKSLVRRLLLFAAVGVALLGGVAVWIWNGPAAAPSEPIAAFSVERLADGSWTPRPHHGRALTLSFGATERVANTNTGSTQGVAAAQGARLPTRSILVMTVHDDPLEQAVAMRIVDGLQRDSYVHRIRYRPRSAEVPIGVAKPDLVVEVDLGPQDRAMLFGSGASTATLSVRVSTGLRRGSVRVTEAEPAPPVIDLGLDITVNASIDQHGFATPNLVFDALAADLGDPVVKHLAKELPSLREQYGVYPSLPPAFAVEYVPVDEGFDVRRVLPEDLAVRHVASWCGPLLHNESWWSARLDASGRAVLEWVAASMEEAGWESKNGYSATRSRYVKGPIEVTFDAVTERHHVGVAEVVREEAQPRVDLFVRYRHRAAPERVEQALRSVLDDGVAPAVLLACFGRLEGGVRELGLRRVRELELDDPGDLVLRARALHSAGDVADAADDLLRALLFADVSFHRRKQTKKVKGVARQLEIELDRERVDPDWLLRNGFHELSKDGPVIEAVATGDQPVRCFVRPRDADGDEFVRLLAVGVDSSKEGSGWVGAIILFDHGSTSSMSGSGADKTIHRTEFGDIHYEFLDQPDDARAEVRVSLR